MPGLPVVIPLLIPLLIPFTIAVQPVQGQLILFPRTFAMGTDTKSYETISVDTGDYRGELEPESDTHRLCKYDEQRSPKTADWRYLVDKPLQCGEIFLKVRGKCIAVSCGYHALVCHMSLEGNLRTMSRPDFDELVSICVPGSNKDRAKAAKMRSFRVPARFIDPGSRGKGLTVNVSAAVVSSHTAIVLLDYSRMSRVHIVSMAQKFTEDDLAPGSEVWPRLWEKFPGGPDWVVERDEALAFLESWRERSVHFSGCSFLGNHGKIPGTPATAGGKNLTFSDLFGPQKLNVTVTDTKTIHPDTPSFELCSDETQYQRLKTHLPDFMNTWVSPKFLKRCGGTPDSLNPLAFNTKSDRNFLSGYVDVYRRRIHDPIQRKFKEVKVHMYSNSQINWYHIITARVPSHWTQNVEETTFRDVTNAGYLTTLRCASFREPLHNKTDLNKAKLLVRPGRPPKIRTRQPGRPRNAITAKKLEALENIPRKRFRTDKGEGGKENEVIDQEQTDGPRRSKRRRTV
ncbi:hypothetical protein C8R47DRAFT_1081163 [Mycena vitilis]|nr:hypothetical protein C8R47DRAFT_1081163 [Mycena vitilis]